MFREYQRPGVCAIEREDSRDRGRVSGLNNSGGLGGGGKSNGSGNGPVGQQTNGGLYTTGKVTSYGAPVRVNALGVETALPAGQTVPGKAIGWDSWQDQVNTYNKAATEWNNRTMTDRILNALAPFGLTSVPPTLGRPATYTGGTFHTGINPASAIAGVAGGIASPIIGGGLLAGLGAGAAYDAMGGQTPVLTGPDVPKTWDPHGNTPYAPGQSGQSPAASGGMGRQNSAADHLNNLARLNANIAGNAAAPASSGTPPTTTPPGPQYTQMMARLQNIYPGYDVSLPGYQYKARATV